MSHELAIASMERFSKYVMQDVMALEGDGEWQPYADELPTQPLNRYQKFWRNYVLALRGPANALAPADRRSNHKTLCQICAPTNRLPRI